MAKVIADELQCGGTLNHGTHKRARRLCLAFALFASARALGFKPLREQHFDNAIPPTAYVGGYYEVSFPAPNGSEIELITGKLMGVGSSWQTLVLAYAYDSMVVAASAHYDACFRQNR